MCPYCLSIYQGAVPRSTGGPESFRCCRNRETHILHSPENGRSYRSRTRECRMAGKCQIAAAAPAGAADPHLRQGAGYPAGGRLGVRGHFALTTPRAAQRSSRELRSAAYPDGRHGRSFHRAELHRRHRGRGRLLPRGAGGQPVRRSPWPPDPVHARRHPRRSHGCHPGGGETPRHDSPAWWASPGRNRAPRLRSSRS